MKALLLLLTLSLAAPTMAGVTGNGGGGVNQNGVYKTFYSAGMYVSAEAETSIPGAELYTKTVMSIAGQNKSMAQLLSAGLPIAHRKFYKILESKMDAGVMDRLLNEYARVVNQPVASLTIFAITDVNQKITYLLPTFYKLSENEQASILFHEAYWILKPRANYSEVVAAESAFQKFVEARESDEFDSELVNILGSVLDDSSLALKTAFKEDARSQKSAALISTIGTMKLGYLFGDNTDLCKKSVENKYTGEGLFGRNKHELTLEAKCKLNYYNLQDILVLSRKFPESYFLKELMRFVSAGNSIEFDGSIPTKKETAEKANRNLFNKGIQFEKVNFDMNDDWGRRASSARIKLTNTDLK